MLIRVAAALLLLVAVSSKEERCHFELTLEVKAGAARQEVRRAAPDLPGLLPRRPTFRISAGEEVTLKWNVLALPRNPNPFPDVTIHSYVAREKEAGQDRPPALDAATVLESALLMDFEPGAAAQGAFKVRLDEPGNYLVQVETLGVFNTEAHEHSAQIDLKVTARGEPAAGAERKEAK
jgi:hypothetical protein